MRLAFDLETQRSFQEVGGRGNFHKLGMSLAVTYDLDSKEYRTYREEDALKLVDALFSANVVIGFNVKRFDYIVLQGYSIADFSEINTIDLLEIIHKQLGFRISLDKLGQATLNEAKSGQGLLALKWYKEGSWDKLEKYCRQDVKITASLYEYGKKNGFLYYPAKGTKKRVDVSW